MKGWTVALILSCLISSAKAAEEPSGQKIRKLHLKRDEIAQVKTAIGIATLIQVPDRPTSVVLGDTNAFKVEYLESAVTIKPLSHSSRSNLYIYTEGRRFNVSLVTVPLPSADYIVYLEPEVVEPSRNPERWRNYSAVRSNHGFSLQITRVGKTVDLILLTFQIKSPAAITFKPDWIWLTQGGKTIAIQELSLSGVSTSDRMPIDGFLSIRVADIQTAIPLILEVRSREPIRIKLPEVKSWLK